MSTKSIFTIGRKCHECDSSDLFWFPSVKTPDVVDGRLRANEVQSLMVLGCNYCSATVDVISSDVVGRHLTDRLNEQNKREEESRRFILDPNVRVLTDLVSDEDMAKAFAGASFGHTDYRGLLSQGCIKALAGWHQGHTITTILHELGLITWDREGGGKISTTDKGHHYVWMAFKLRPNAKPAPDYERAARRLASCMDYPWEEMHEQGRQSMREHAKSIVESALGVDHE